MYQPLADLGVNFFMTNFIVDDPAMSLIHYLPDFYARIGFSGPALPQMCTAVGLVGLANKSHRKDMFNVATTNYAAAIRAINSALLCPQRAAQDSILASIFLAAMFEALIIPRNEGMDNCCTHLAGAVSVAHLMLKQGKHTTVIIQQYTTIVKTVIVNCWVQEVSLPPHFFEFKKLVEKKAARVSVHDLLLDIVMELLQFKKDIQSAVKQILWSSYKEPWPSMLLSKMSLAHSITGSYSMLFSCQLLRMASWLIEDILIVSLGPYQYSQTLG